MKAGVIDIGSNSLKLTIAERRGEDIHVLESLRNILPIGRHAFFKSRISQETINQAIAILEKYKKVLSDYDITATKVIATTAVREAKNKDIFIDTIYRKTGFYVEILSVGDVVYYINGYLSRRLRHTYPIETRNLLIAELGAGALDVSVMEKGYIMVHMGLPIGTMRLRQLMDKLGGSMKENSEAVREYVENEFHYLGRTMPRMPSDDAILIDETYINYLETLLPRKREDMDFFALSLSDVAVLSEKLIDRNVEEVAREYKMPLEIADLIVGYIMILRTLFLLTRNKHIYILRTSLSEAMLGGMLIEREMSSRYNKRNQLISAVHFICNKYNADIDHAESVAKISERLFESLKGYLGLAPEHSLYLILAAYLHDIGTFIHNRSHHKHSEYIISTLSLFRLDPEEIKIIACIARYHRKGIPMRSHLMYSALPFEKQLVVQKLSALLKIANALDRSHRKKVQKLEVRVNRMHGVTLTVTTNQNYTLERNDFLAKKGLFEEITGGRINLVVNNYG